ncbi:NYN domain-containing protein [Clostridia bacterium]|nr:NYN domain-containing protein [Clostridia bacterium]
MKRLIIIDGYNLLSYGRERRLFDFERLEDGRDFLKGLLMNFAGFQQQDLILVYDGAGKKEDIEEYKHLQIVYSKKDETADTYIEKATDTFVRQGYNVTVVTSDYEEQKCIFGSGAIRLSSREFLEDLKNSKRKEKNYFMDQAGQRNYLDADMDEEVMQVLKAMLRP